MLALVTSTPEKIASAVLSVTLGTYADLFDTDLDACAQNALTERSSQFSANLKTKV